VRRLNLRGQTPKLQTSRDDRLAMMNKMHVGNALLLLLAVMPAAFAGASVVVVEDFEDGDVTVPFYWSVASSNCDAVFDSDSGAGYGGSVYAGHGSFDVDSNFGWASFLGVSFGGAFFGDGVVLQARGSGIWDLNIITSDINPLVDPMPYVRFELDSSWDGYYFRWFDVTYPHHAVNRPDIQPENIHSLTIVPQSQQAGQTGEFWIDDLGYVLADSISPGDVDGDGIPNQHDYDADNDGWFNTLEGFAGSGSLDAGSYPLSELGVPSTCYTGLFPIMYWTDESHQFEALTGMKGALMAVFVNGWGDATTFYHFNRALCDFIARHGAIPVYQWPILNSARGGVWEGILDSTFRLNDIIQGSVDLELAEFAAEVRDWKMPLILNPVVEYNQGFTSYHGLSNFGPIGMSIPPRSLLGTLGQTWIGDSLIAYCDTVPAESVCTYYGDPFIPDGPERLRDALLHIKSVFETQGADNVIWTMQAHPIVDPQHLGAWTNLSHYYSAAYVDWHSLSAHHGFITDSLRSLSYVISDCYDSLVNLDPGKPILIIEFALHSDDNGGADMTGVLLSDFSAELPDSFPMIKGWTYANSDRYGTDYSNTSLQIDSDRYAGEIAAFASVASDPFYIKDPILFPRVGARERDHADYNDRLRVYPNPSTGLFTIRFSMAGATVSSELRVGVYDVCGRLMEELEPGERRGAWIVLDWDARDRPNGLYFLRFETGNSVSTRKLVSLKPQL